MAGILLSMLPITIRYIVFPSGRTRHRPFILSIYHLPRAIGQTIARFTTMGFRRLQELGVPTGTNPSGFMMLPPGTFFSLYKMLNRMNYDG